MMRTSLTTYLLFLQTILLSTTSDGFQVKPVHQQSFGIISRLSSNPKLNQPRVSHNNLKTELGATWSNGQAIQEYQDFLSGKTSAASQDDGPSLIIAPPEGNPLADALVKLGMGDDVIIRPDDPIPPIVGDRTEFPIFVAIPPSQLSSCIARNLSNNWDEKRDDLVFFTTDKGCIEPILKRYSLCRDQTSQVLVSFSTPGGMDLTPKDLSVMFGTDANGEEKRAIETASCGKWKDAIAKRLEQNDIRCRSVFYREWRRLMWEKTVFDTCFHLIGAVREEPTTLADVAMYYNEEVSEMAWQLSSLLRGSLAITLTYGFEERMFEYGQQSGAEIRCTVSDETFPYTNGVFLETTEQGLRMGFGDPAPMHTEYLVFAVKERGLLQSVKLPESVGEQRPSIMRQGALRADGVI